MKKLEEKIEQYIRYPETLSETEREVIRISIEKNDHVAKLAKWFREFYKLADKRAGKAKSTRFELNPIRHKPAEDDHRFVLAAMSPKAATDGVDEIMTYVSEANQTVLRVLKNNRQNTINLHVISSRLDDNESAILYIKEKDRYIITKPGGKLSLPYGKPWTKNDLIWKNCEILLPLETFSLADIQKKERITVEELNVSFIPKRENGYGLFVSSQESENAYSILAQSKEGKNQELFFIDDREMEVTIGHAIDPALTVISFYS